MVGQGVLRECLLDREVKGILALGPRGTGQQHQKLRVIENTDINRADMRDGGVAR